MKKLARVIVIALILAVCALSAPSPVQAVGQQPRDREGGDVLQGRGCPKHCQVIFDRCFCP